MKTLSDEELRLGLVFYEQNKSSVKKLCRCMIRRVPRKHRAQCFELAMDEAMRTIPMALLTYDSSRGASVRTHVLGCVRWYIWKVMVRYARRDEHREPLNANHRAGLDHAQTMLRDEVESLLSYMSDDDAELLRWRFIDEMSLNEIGEMLDLDCAASAVCRMIQDALEVARRIAREDA